MVSQNVLIKIFSLLKARYSENSIQSSCNDTGGSVGEVWDVCVCKTIGYEFAVDNNKVDDSQKSDSDKWKKIV